MCTALQVGGAGLGFGALGAHVGGSSQAVPASAAGLARAPAEQKTAAALEAGFARGGLESTVEGTLQPAPAPMPAASAAAPAPPPEAAPPPQQVLISP